MDCNFEYCDIYSKQIGFFFNNKDKIGTNFGLFLTIIYIFISSFFFIFYLVNTLKRTNLNVYDSITYSQDIPITNINPNTLYFAFGLEDPKTSNRFIDETIYFVKLLFFDREKINGEFVTTNRIELESEPCKEEKFGKEYKNLLTPGELNNSYCLKDFNLSLVGGYKFNKFSYLRIRIYPCINSTENDNHCKPQDIIDNYIKGGYFSILTKDIGLNPNNISYPVIYTLQDLYTTIDKSMYRDFILYYGITEIESDMGLFFEDIEIKKYLQFRKEVQSFYFRDESEYYGGKAMCSIDFRLDELIYIQKRTYSKMQEAFSIIGGYMQLTTNIFSLISFLSNRVFPELKILNEIFNYNFNKKKITMKIRTLKDLTIKHSFNNLYFPSKKVNLDTNNLSQINIINNSGNSLIEIDNKISTHNNFINERKNSIFNEVKKNEKENEKKNMKKNYSIKLTLFDQDNKSNKNTVINHSYRYSCGNSFHNKLKYANNIDFLNEYVDKINFNFFDYYCLRKLSKKKSDIELFKIGLSLYKKRMDIINVFTILLLIEKRFLPFEK